jgi:hypothetical protein
MELTELNIHNNTVKKFCIQWYINKEEKDYRCDIIESQHIIIDNNVEHECIYDTDFVKSKYYIKKNNFYAIDALFKPIPYNMEIFCINYSDSHPIIINDIFVNYDVFSFKKYNKYFIAYNQQVPNSIPLYIFKFNNSILLSNEDKYPTDDIGWERHTIPVIYVLNNSTNTFSCYEGTIIHDPTSNKTFYQNILFCKPKTFFNIIEDIKKENNVKKNKPKNNKQNCIIF